MTSTGLTPGPTGDCRPYSEFPPSSPVRSGLCQGSKEARRDPPSEKQDDKPPHDARTIFVGRSFATPREVSAPLFNGEDADAASNLIEVLHIREAETVHGTNLALRTSSGFSNPIDLIPVRALVVSYQRFPEPAPGRVHMVPTVRHLELPTAMRIWKAKGARFHNIAYNAEAFAQDVDDTREGVESDDVLLIHPLSFDEDTIRAMSSYFGHVERISPFQVDDAQPELVEGPFTGSLIRCYPHPHDAPRSPVMDTGCWEVKWEFRDDCVSALMALRRVPHLTVTWAHQPSYSGWECRYPNYSHLQHPSIQPIVVNNHQLSSLPSFTSASPFSVDSSSSAGHLYPGGTHGSIQANQAARNHIVHSSHAAMNSLPEPGLGWSVWRPPFAKEPLLRPGGSYPAPPRYTGDTNSEIPSTPRTPSSVYPLTPTSCTDEEKPLDHAPELQEVPAQRSIDPTSLFVGGLELVGPSAWDESKVRQHFSKYGGLQHVKLVRPMNGVTGFAFLKFDNTDGPARAVLEEHNRVCGSHVLRVRLRDCNPPRNHWKHGRGRGRLFHHSGPGYRKFHFVDRFNDELNARRPNIVANDDATAPASQPDTVESASPKVSTRGSLDDDCASVPPSDSEDSADPPPSAADFEKTEGEPERYREWYDELDAAAAASSHQALSVSPSTVMFPPPYPYMLHNAPYFGHPMPWTQPYFHPPVPYPSPYLNPYPMYQPMIAAPNQSTSVAVEQGQISQHTWPPQGVIYAPPHLRLPGPSAPHPSAETPTKVPSPEGPSSGNSLLTPNDPSGVGSLPPPPGLPQGPASPQPLANIEHLVVGPVPTSQTQVPSTPRIIIQPSIHAWHGIPPMIAAPAHFGQAHIPVHQPPWMQSTQLPHLQEGVHQMQRQQQPARSKRQSIRYSQGQAAFQGGKIAHQQRAPYRNNLRPQAPPSGIVGPSVAAAISSRQPAVQAEEKQPPVWI
ncbi:hypothetical protein NMY22_g4349 [Coprinellus aureogranulatus]|nr:hypothetical protein NMY22_g4349 [Coprinellus aureogranulatus]